MKKNEDGADPLAAEPGGDVVLVELECAVRGNDDELLCSNSVESIEVVMDMVLEVGKAREVAETAEAGVPLLGSGTATNEARPRRVALSGVTGNGSQSSSSGGGGSGGGGPPYRFNEGA